MDNKITDYIQDIIGGLTNLSAEIEKQQKMNEDKLMLLEETACRNKHLLMDIAKLITDRLE